MDSSCILCFRFDRDLLNFIEANSSQWQEFEITQVLEKHFWTMNIHTDSRICLSCWQVISEFHNFYVSIQQAHENLADTQVNDELYAISKEKDEINKNKNFAYDYLEPEVVTEKNEDQDDNRSSTEESNYNSEDNYINNDLLEKSSYVKIRIRRYIKTSPQSQLCERNVKDDKAKLELSDSSDDNVSVSDGAYIDFSKHYDMKKRPSRKENDEFIAKHFKQMFCDLCEMPFENFSSIPKHFLTVHNLKKGYLVCCNRKFYQRNPLVDHLHSHLDPDYFKCNQCDKTLSDRKNLNDHMLRVHKPDDIALKHSCEICGKSFIKGHLLRDHKLTHLPKEEKMFPCNECGKRYATSRLLKLHTELVHLKKHSKICYICGKTLNTSTEYKLHMNKHEGISPIINCDVCGLRVTTERSLKLHKESQHPIGGKKEHPCPVCKRVSQTAKALKKHIVTMHERGCDHKCTVCEKAFRRSEALKEHMASQHTGVTLYTCPWCPRTFNSNSNMHTHRKNVHPKESLELRLQKYSKNIPPKIS